MANKEKRSICYRGFEVVYSSDHGWCIVIPFEGQRGTVIKYLPFPTQRKAKECIDKQELLCDSEWCYDRKDFERGKAIKRKGWEQCNI